MQFKNERFFTQKLHDKTLFLLTWKEMNILYKYLFIESKFTSLARSSPSILDNLKVSLEKALFTT